MKVSILVNVIVTGAILTAAAEAAQQVTVTADVEGQAIEQVFEVGDIVSVPIYVSSEGGAAIFGVDFEAAVTTDAVRIHAVSFDPAFSRTLGSSETTLPGKRYHAVRVQPLATIDRTLGTDGEPILLATVELEVLQAERFESALEVNTRCALVGAVPEVTTVLGVESVGDASRHGRIEIANTRPIPEPEPDPWTWEEASLALEVQPLGGGEPVTVLAPHTTYELHYQAGYDRVNAYVLFAVATSPGHGFAGASPPPAGDWSATGDFGFVDIEAEFDGLATPHGYPEGYFRYQMAYDDFWPDTDKYAGPQGHFCNFTTQSPGEINLELYLCWLDNEAYESAEMYTQVVFIVQESAVDDGDVE